VETGKAGSGTVSSSSSQKLRLKRSAYLDMIKRVRLFANFEGSRRMDGKADLGTGVVAALQPRNSGRSSFVPPRGSGIHDLNCQFQGGWTPLTAALSARYSGIAIEASACGC
jgi:hypothetical protein